MRYWWVNQNQTFRAEVRGSFMWSPKRKADGARNPFYDHMREVSPGDIVFSFCDTRIKAAGIVTGPAQTGPKPDFGAVGLNWAQEGWYVPVDYCVLETQIRPKDHIDILRSFLPARYSPLQASGARPPAGVPRRGARADGRCAHCSHRSGLLRRPCLGR